MAKGKRNNFDANEFAEEVIDKLGGISAFAELLTSAVRSGDNLLVKEKMITLIVRIIDRMGPKRTGSSDMTDAEVDDAIRVEIVREFASMPDEDYRATIRRIENARAGQEAGGQHPQGGDAAVGEASPVAGTVS